MFDTGYRYAWSHTGSWRIRPLLKPKWKATTPTNFEIFVRNLHFLLPADSWLVLEGGAIAPEIKAYLLQHARAECPAVTLGTDYGECPPPIYHIPVQEAVLAGLADLSRNYHEYAQWAFGQPYASQTQICDHLKAYRTDAELLDYNDVGEVRVWWYVAADVEETRLREFCDRVGCYYRPAACGQRTGELGLA